MPRHLHEFVWRSGRSSMGRMSAMSWPSCCLLVALLVSFQTLPSSAQTNFVSGSASFVLAKNQPFTGRNTSVALTSPDNSWQLALIIDGFGVDNSFQYCWTEIHDSATAKNVIWRRPCSHTIKVDHCSLILSSDGDFRLAVGADGGEAFEFRTQTGGNSPPVTKVELTNKGDLLLVASDNSTVWQSSDHVDCTGPFDPATDSGPRLIQSSGFLIWMSILAVLSTLATSQFF